MSWPCFMIEETTRCRGFLRRYAHLDPNVPGRKRECSNKKWGYHNASAQIFEGEMSGFGVSLDDQGCYRLPDLELQPPRDDPRWPKKCENCDELFLDGDEWQITFDVIYRAADGREFTLRTAPAGAMWHARWLARWETHNVQKDPNGPLHVMLPDGTEWNIDGPASKGGYWTRTGTPPNLTVTPSILSPGYHGHLTAGALTDPC